MVSIGYCLCLFAYFGFGLFLPFWWPLFSYQVEKPLSLTSGAQPHLLNVIMDVIVGLLGLKCLVRLPFLLALFLPLNGLNVPKIPI